MREALVIETRREVYSMRQAVNEYRDTMTVGQLKALLEDLCLDDDTPIYTSHDNGYTYGTVCMSDFETQTLDGDDELE
ncbi:MAG: hypothetical protein IKH61_12855 [Bacteroidales bacterium]|nr:hypothetical protein [Bacteroidales bacterium]